MKSRSWIVSLGVLVLLLLAWWRLGPAEEQGPGVTVITGPLQLTSMRAECKQDFRKCGPKLYRLQGTTNLLTEREVYFLSWAAQQARADGGQPQGGNGSDYHHSNTIYTHGVGLQPEDVSFPYAGDFHFSSLDITPILPDGGSGSTLKLDRCTPGPGTSRRCIIQDPSDVLLCQLKSGLRTSTVTVLQGRWDPVTGWHDGEKFLTIACGHDDADGTDGDGAISKCVHLARYCPGNSQCNDRFEACVRAVTAQYCGGACNDPQAKFCSYTDIGVSMSLYNMRWSNGTYQDPSNGPGQLYPACPQKSCFEASWSRQRAVELSSLRKKQRMPRCASDYAPGGDPQQGPDVKAAVVWTRFDVAPATRCPDPDCPKPTAAGYFKPPCPESGP